MGVLGRVLEKLCLACGHGKTGGAGREERKEKIISAPTVLQVHSHSGLWVSPEIGTMLLIFQRKELRLRVQIWPNVTGQNQQQRQHEKDVTVEYFPRLPCALPFLGSPSYLRKACRGDVFILQKKLRSRQFKWLAGK